MFCVCPRHQGYNIISDQFDHKQGFSESCEQSQWRAEVVPRGPQTRKPTQHDRDLAPNEKDANNKTKIRHYIRSLLLSHYFKTSKGRDFLCQTIEVSGLFSVAASFEILLLKKYWELNAWIHVLSSKVTRTTIQRFTSHCVRSCSFLSPMKSWKD